MLNAYSTLLLVIFLLVLIVLIVSALTVRKKKKVNAQNYDKNRKDKAWLAGMKAYSKAYYIRNNKRIKSNAIIAYKINRKNKLAAASALSKLRPGYIQEKFKKWYNRNKSSKQLKARRYSKLMYSQNPLLKKEKAREHSAVNYSQNPEPIKQRARRYSAATYSQDPEPIKQRAREHSAVIYSQNPEPQRKRAREFSAKSYKDNPEPKKLKSRESYEQNSDSKKNNALKRYHDNRKAILTLLRNDYVKNKYSKRAIARLINSLNKENRKRINRTYYESNFNNVLYRMRSNYALSSPNNETKEYYHDKIMEFIVNYPDIVEKLISSINVNDNEDQSYDVKCRVATSILLESVLKNRIHKIGLLISTVNSVRKYQLKDESDFGERYHTQYSEPYYYDSAYLLPDESNKINKAIPIDANGKCHIAVLVTAKLDNDDDDNAHQDEQQDKNKKPEPQMLKWLCTDRCKLLTENDIKAIIEIRQYFDEPIKLLRQNLEDCDNDCPNYHYTRVNLHQEEIDSLDIVVDESSDDNCLMTNVVVYSKLDENNAPHCVKYTETVTELDGHPRICFSNDSKCCSKLRRLRSASVHYPNLRRLLKHFYKARKSHRTIDSIDTCLASGDVIELMKLRISENDEDQLRGTELYIIVNGQPTKSNTVWQTLVDVNRIKAALLKLKEINWLYRNVDDDTIDASSKEVIEVLSNTTCKMLEKATEADVQGLQAFTIRKLDTKIVKDSDISQYKLLNVREQAIDDRQSHLDLMCFPNLFPTGRFGENHPRQVKLDFSEYVKSRLLNKDSRFRKTSQFVFRLYRSKVKRDLNSGIYNYLKHTRYTGKSVAEIMAMVDKNDLELEGNLSTILQPVRGTNQYWYKVKGELKCMIREWGSPTFFLTLTCAEYDSADISQYLRTVNNVPQSYNIARLCTEDPISVSRQFSYKFHDFFNIVIMKWAVLGTVDHYYWKKEYQMRGAPHYHIVLWIRDSPVLGRDSPEKVLSFIQERITCHIPDSKTSPDLHALVTKYQMHKCNAYCKRNLKFGKTYVT